MLTPNFFKKKIMKHFATTLLCFLTFLFKKPFFSYFKSTSSNCNTTGRFVIGMAEPWNQTTTSKILRDIWRSIYYLQSVSWSSTYRKSIFLFNIHQNWGLQLSSADTCFRSSSSSFSNISLKEPIAMRLLKQRF